jgi:hypothetical protein
MTLFAVQASTWDRPRILVRYEDVENPSPWVAVDAQDEETGEWKVHYYHVPAKTELPVINDFGTYMNYFRSSSFFHVHSENPMVRAYVKHATGILPCGTATTAMLTIVLPAIGTLIGTPWDSFRSGK